jgi:DNA-binding PadR family transcriptional regulator
VESLIDYAVLALLIERPSYGYELYARYERRFGELLPTSKGNVYEVLKRLEREGYVEKAGTSGSLGRPRVNRRVTEGGLAASRSWLGERLRDDPRRLELFGRLASVGLRDPNPDPASTEPLSELLWELLVEQQRRVAAAQLEWVTYARSRVCAWAADRSAGEEPG